MKFIKIMEGVLCGPPHRCEYAALFRNDAGRLIVVGNGIDMFNLLKWVDENPLTQFREMTPLENGLNEWAKKPFEPHELFSHLFENGAVL